VRHGGAERRWRATRLRRQRNDGVFRAAARLGAPAVQRAGQRGPGEACRVVEAAGHAAAGVWRAQRRQCANHGVLSRHPNAPGELNAAATGGGSAARGRHMASERVAESYDASYGAHGETARPFPLPSFLASRTRRDVQQRRRA
jgi:hypothetical protein